MNKKYLSYAILPVMALSLIGVGAASAHGMLEFGSNATPQEIGQRQTDIFQQQANMLGVSVDEIKNAWAQGKTLQELATEKGITQEQLQQRMREAHSQQMKAHLQVLVDQGVITQAQADQRLQVMEQRAASGKTGKLKGFGHRGMMW